MVSHDQLEQWNLLIQRYYIEESEETDEIQHQISYEITAILKYCIAGGSKLATFLTAAGLWQRISAVVKNESKYDFEIVLASTIAVAAEMHEVDLICADDLQIISNFLYSDVKEKPNICTVTDAELCQCLCYVFEKLNGECYTRTLLVDFLFCIFLILIIYHLLTKRKSIAMMRYYKYFRSKPII